MYFKGKIMFNINLKSLHDLVMDEDPNEQKATPTSPVAPAPAGYPPMPAGQTFGGVNNQYIDALRAAIKARPTALTALTAAAEKLTTVIPDANMRLKAAFQMVKSEGRGVKELLDAITVHVADLESQKLQFSRAMETESQNAIGKLQADANTFTSSTQVAQQQIKQLQQQLEQLNSLIVTNNNAFAETTQKINVEKSRLGENAQQFDTALTVVKSELENQRVVIQSALS
jgi:chromosome segregation ATPase